MAVQLATTNADFVNSYEAGHLCAAFLKTANIEGGTCCFLAGPTASVETGKAPKPRKIACVA